MVRRQRLSVDGRSRRGGSIHRNRLRRLAVR